MEFIKQWWNKNRSKAIAVIITEIVTGFFLSFLIEVKFGTDPCTFMNLSISDRLGISFGTWQFLLNLILLVFVLLFSKLRYIGIGTVANMVLIGYSADFCRFLWARVFPSGFFTQTVARIAFFVIGLVGFVICCAIYMNLDMGLSPYDALPKIIHEHVRTKSFTPVRMCWDFSVIIIGMIVGWRLPEIGVVAMALFLGPVIGFVGRHWR